MKKNDMLSSLSDCQKEELYKEGLELIEDQDCQLGAIDSMPTLNISGIFVMCCYPAAHTCTVELSNRFLQSVSL